MIPWLFFPSPFIFVYLVIPYFSIYIYIPDHDNLVILYSIYIFIHDHVNLVIPYFSIYIYIPDHDNLVIPSSPYFRVTINSNELSICLKLTIYVCLIVSHSYISVLFGQVIQSGPFSQYWRIVCATSLPIGLALPFVN